MALTPLEVEARDNTGRPVEGAVIEIRHELTGITAVGYNRDGSAMTPPFKTDVVGAKQVWLPNGLYEWRSTGGWVSNWRAFPAYRGRGREARLEVAPGSALPTKEAIPVADGGVDNLLGTFKVTLDFSHDHMGVVQILLVPPWEAARVLAVLPGSAVDGGGTLVGAEVEVRDAATGDPVVLTDLGGTPLSTPYLTDANGLFGDSYAPAGIYEWRVPTSTNLTAWTPAMAMNMSFSLYDAVTEGFSDYTFDGTVIYSDTGTVDQYSPIAEGDTVLFDFRTGAEGRPSNGVWTVWIAGAGTGTLNSATLELVPL